MYKHRNKRIRKRPTAAMGTAKFEEFLGSFVGYQLSGNSIIDMLLNTGWVPDVGKFASYERNTVPPRGYVNGQTYTLWIVANSRELHKNPLHPSEIGVCCAEFQNRILGSLFFVQTITTENYPHLLTQFVACLEEKGRICLSLQDGANAHTANTTTTFLLGFLCGPIGGRRRRPPRSPDLTQPDFFL